MSDTELTPDAIINIEVRPVQVGEITGTTVLVGAPGADGKDGKDGINGKDGIDGKDGQPGRDGVDGKDGPVGPQGNPGRDGVDGKDGGAGPQGPAGPGVAAGGNTGQVLVKKSATDYDTGWGGYALPAGGNSNTWLRKNSSTDGDAIWATPSLFGVGSMGGTLQSMSAATVDQSMPAMKVLPTSTASVQFAVIDSSLTGRLWIRAYTSPDIASADWRRSPKTTPQTGNWPIAEYMLDLSVARYAIVSLNLPSNTGIAYFNICILDMNGRSLPAGAVTMSGLVPTYKM